MSWSFWGQGQDETQEDKRTYQGEWDRGKAPKSQGSFPLGCPSDSGWQDPVTGNTRNEASKTGMAVFLGLELGSRREPWSKSWSGCYSEKETRFLLIVPCGLKLDNCPLVIMRDSLGTSLWWLLLTVNLTGFRVPLGDTPLRMSVEMLPERFNWGEKTREAFRRLKDQNE